MARAISLVTLWLTLSVVPTSGEPEQVNLPLPADRLVLFSQDIQPIFSEHCMECHARGKTEGGFAIDTREQILTGSDNGRVVVTGNSADSYLIDVVGNPDSETPMPLERERLSDEEVGILRAWIDQGMAWSTGFSFAWFKEAPLYPRKPVVPGGEDGTTNPIDRFVDRYFGRAEIAPPDIVSDRLFARRVYYDTIGLPPPPEELENFLADASPDKRAQLVDRLLADDRGYAENWISFWNDLLRNDFAGTGYIDGGRTEITKWLYRSLEENKPYNQFVQELIAPTQESKGFIEGIVWRGVTNSSQTPEMQAAQNLGQVFLGINLKCASCHDSFISNWTLEDSHNLAGIFSDEPLEMHRCDSPTGETASVRFLFEQLGRIDASQPKEERQARLAEILTSEKNGRFARTLVNRLWTKLLGHGLIEPNDEMDNDPWDTDLLDWLAVDFVENGYDLKQTLRRILTSRTYQLPSVSWDGKNVEEFVFHGPTVRRLTAEQFVDSLSAITESWEGAAASAVEIEETTPYSQWPRSWLLNRDPLTVAMGRPNREVIVSQRPSAATTLQGLELTNGSILAKRLKTGASNLANRFESDYEKLAHEIYLEGMARTPSQEEVSLVTGIIEGSTAEEAIEDFLWAMAMLPEFQLIY